MTDKKKGATPCESAPQTDTPDSTRETPRETSSDRGLYLPLLWAINAKRMGGGIAAELAGLLALATMALVLLMGGA